MNILSALTQYRHSLKGATHLETTQLQLINLDLLKTRYQERWPKVRSRIFDTCEQFILKRMGPDDVVLRANNGFVVLPGPSRAETAEAFTARIELELKAFFLGTDYLRELGLEADTVNLAIADLFGGIHSDPVDAAARAHEVAADGDTDDPGESNNPPIASPRPSEPVRLPDFQLRFEPVWASATGFAALCLVRPTGRMRGDGPRVRGHALSPSEGGGAMRMEFDRKVLMMAAAAWECAAAQGTPGALAVPVHFETLVTVKYRLPYMAAINALDERTRKAMILRVIGTSMDALMGSITEVCRLARSLARRIMVEVDPNTIRLDRFNDSCVDIFSIKSPQTAEIFARKNASLATFAGKLARQHTMLAVEDCHDGTALARWMAVGPDYLSGKAVAEERLQPIAPVRFTPGEALSAPEAKE